VRRIGSGEEPDVAGEGDWVLKGAVRDLFREFAQVQNGTIDRISFHRGLPCLVEVSLESTVLPPEERAGRAGQ
jgi:hypothetical protein